MLVENVVSLDAELAVDLLGDRRVLERLRSLPPSKADVDFMQGMIMHHGQAVEMTELLKTRSKDPAMIELGHKIDVSQSDEIRWMKAPCACTRDGSSLAIVP